MSQRLTQSTSNSVKNSDECLVETVPLKKHILRRHMSADVLGVGSSTSTPSPSSKLPGNGPRSRLQRATTGSRFFRDLNLNPGHLLVSRISEANLLKDNNKVTIFFNVTPGGQNLFNVLRLRPTFEKPFFLRCKSRV